MTLRAGIPLRRIQEISGHNDLETPIVLPQSNHQGLPQAYLWCLVAVPSFFSIRCSFNTSWLRLKSGKLDVTP